MGTIMPVAFQFAPQDWQTCQGQNLPVNQYSALFSLLGITFGGSQSQNFNLPDLTGRTIIGQGNLNLNGVVTQYNTGVKGGAVTATLSTANVPLAPHVHPLSSGSATASVNIQATIADADSNVPTGSNVLAGSNGSAGGEAIPVNIYGPAGVASNMKTIASGSVSLSGLTVGANQGSGATPFNIREPYLPLYYIIAVNGIYPTRL
jgi:microcystin-dependent protein